MTSAFGKRNFVIVLVPLRIELLSRFQFVARSCLALYSGGNTAATRLEARIYYERGYQPCQNGYERRLSNLQQY